MERKIIELKKLTDYKWINLFNIKYTNAKGILVNWIFASRKEDPFNDERTDAVVIIPILKTADGNKIVITKEYRIAIRDFEYGFPAGLREKDLSLEQVAKKELKEETGLEVKGFLSCSNRVYTSPGLSDESCVMVFVEAEGEVSKDFQELSEDIEVILMGVEEVKNLLKDPYKKIGAKAWGILYYYSQIGEIK